MHRLPKHLGLLWYVPLWTMMALIAIAALFVPHGGTWRRDGAVLVLCMTGCAIAEFIPVAYFDGISTTRHMAGMNMATALAVPISIALVISMMHQALTRTWQRSRAERVAAARDLRLRTGPN
jgi:NADH:ubiquinone oxidoreductase subunit 6 (subunit J)